MAKKLNPRFLEMLGRYRRLVVPALAKQVEFQEDQKGDLEIFRTCLGENNLAFERLRRFHERHGYQYNGKGMVEAWLEAVELIHYLMLAARQSYIDQTLECYLKEELHRRLREGDRYRMEFGEIDHRNQFMVLLNAFAKEVL